MSGSAVVLLSAVSASNACPADFPAQLVSSPSALGPHNAASILSLFRQFQKASLCFDNFIQSLDFKNNLKSINVCVGDQERNGK